MKNRAQQLIHVYYLPLRWGFKGPMEGTSQYQQFLQTSIIGVAYIYTLFNYRRLYLDPIFLIIPHSCVCFVFYKVQHRWKGTGETPMPTQMVPRGALMVELRFGCSSTMEKYGRI